jgi:hypothetical protein
VNGPVAGGRPARAERLHRASRRTWCGHYPARARWRHEAVETEPEPPLAPRSVDGPEAAVLVELQHAPGMALAGDQGPNRAEQLVLTRMPSEADELTGDLLAAA